MKVIILSSTKYKEKDGIIDAITESGPISFLGRGIYKPTAKNHQLVDGLLIADVEAVTGTSNHAIVRRSKILLNPRKPDSDYLTMSTILLLAEASKKCISQDDYHLIFPHLENAIISLCDSKKPWNIALVYLAKILRLNGYDLEVNACVNCGTKKGITSFSFAEGGFLCKACTKENNINQDLTPDQMILIRDVFNAPDYLHFGAECTKENAAILLGKFKEFISEVLGTNLSTISFFLKG